MVFTFFIYGLAFFLLGVTTLIYPKKNSQFRLAESLWLIALFGLFHGVTEWLDMFILIRPMDEALLKYIRMFTLPISFCFLVQFGITNIVKINHKNPVFQSVPLFFLVVWIIITETGSQKLLTGDIAARYLLCLPGTLLTSYALMLHAPDLHNQQGTVRNLKLTAGSFLVYGFLAGLIVPQTRFFPASIINYGTFFNVVGIPVQIFRALCALVILYAISRLLNMFELETMDSLRRARDELENRVKVRTASLRESEQFIRSILDTVDEGFIVIDRDYRIMTANKAFCSQVGGCDEDIIGSHCYEISHKVNRPCHDEGQQCAVRQVFESGKPHTVLHRHNDAGGNILYVETKAYPIKDSSGAVTSVIETINNITEKHLLEEERLKTQKLESIGTLAGGIAHDFNNLLQGIFGYISIAKMTIGEKDKSLAMLTQAEEALHTSVNLTTQLLTFSKGGKPVKKLIRIGSAVENAAKFALSGSHANYEMDFPTDLWPVEADEGQLAQVIQNVVLNANEAMAGSGTVCVSLANVDIAKDTIVGLPDGGQFVRMAIQDSGVGISEQILAKIFDPYFTTKQKGSGLGLATSYSIIKNHGGVIEVESILNRGTTFTIYLPASRGTEVEAGPTTSAVVGTKKGRILLMDDEDMVRNVAREMLVALGNEVVCAEDGRKAIDLYREARETGTPFDLVILDLTVKGGMGGDEAIMKIRDIDPGVKAVVSSGYADSPVVANYRAFGFSAVLNKPYKIGALQSCLNLLIS